MLLRQLTLAMLVLARRCLILFFSNFVLFETVWALQYLPLPICVILIVPGFPVVLLGHFSDFNSVLVVSDSSSLFL